MGENDKSSVLKLIANHQILKRNNIKYYLKIELCVNFVTEELF